MNRRTILGTLPILPFVDVKKMLENPNAANPTAVTKPKRLEKGNTIALIAPSGPVPDQTVDKALLTLTEMGFKVQLGKYIREKNGYFAGTDAQRAHDLNAAFADKNVHAVWCIRGGYGATRVLPKVNFDVIQKNPKIFIGYSDITAFHTAIFQKTGLVTFHGPVGNMEHSDYTKKYLWEILTNPNLQQTPLLLETADENRKNIEELYQVKTLNPGVAKGQLIGGNLTLLAAMAGTPFALEQIKGKILFMEDIEEQPYRIDAMLTQLMRNLDLNQCAGIALGIFAGCNPKPPEPSHSLLECLNDKFDALKIPIVYGLSFGHIHHQFTLPVGVQAELDANKGLLKIVDAAVL